MKPATPRPELGEIQPYAAPQPPARVRLNTNESPHSPPAEVVEEILSAARDLELNRYPDSDATELFRALADHLGTSLESLWIANGSNEILLHLFLAFGGPGRTCLTFEPTYSLHSTIPRLAGTSLVKAERTENFVVDVEAAVALVREAGPDIVMLCSPNNPSGGVEPLGTTELLLQETPGLVVVDEAYIDFADKGDSALRMLDRYENLVVVRTFSKAWRLASMRLGYMVADPRVAGEMSRVRLPYHLAGVTQAAGRAVLEHIDAMAKSIEAIRKERDRLVPELGALGATVYPSKANFILFRVDDATRVWNALLDKGVLVRNYSGHRLLRGCLRVTVGLPEENDAFVSAIQEVLDG
ncbi:MAG: histidinol-phosphate transaminase [Actinomycetota bacterium]|nr:histidinol-phosphate transaminase [Actinomycetota bacterium]